MAGFERAVVLGAVLALVGCGEESGGEGGGAPAPACQWEDRYDEASCPTSYSSECRVYVDGDIARSGDGWSWATAVGTVQEGIDLAYCGRTEAGACDQYEVWVKAGSYYLQQGCAFDHLQLRPGVGVYGGFRGDEELRAQRDAESHATILDGRDGPDGGKHVFHVVIGSYGAVLDGFTVQQGRAVHDSEALHRSGAGMGNFAASPTVRNCIFRDNEAADRGAAIASHDGSAPQVQDCTFEQNTAHESGGAVSVSGESAARVDRCRFQDNAADFDGGAIHADGGGVEVLDSTFQDNGASGHGGAIAIVASEAALAGCFFDGNEAALHGGAVWAHGGSDLTVTGSAFTANLALQGGGLQVEGAAAALVTSACTFSGNRALDTGGGIGVSGASLQLELSEVDGNQAQDGGGLGVWTSATDPMASVALSETRFEGNTATLEGGGIGAFGADLELDQVDVVGNQAAQGAGLFLGDLEERVAIADVSASLFEGNAAIYVEGQDGMGLGGGMALRGDVEASLLDSEIRANEAWRGAGIYLEVGALTVSTGTFADNVAGQFGGGIGVLHGALTVAQSLFETNLADDGGGLANVGGDVQIDASIFRDNDASTHGGGVMMGTGAETRLTNTLLFGNAAPLGGAIEAGTAGPLSLLHCTLADNLGNSAIYDAADLSVTGSILWNPAAAGEIAASGAIAPSVSYSDVRGGHAGVGNLGGDLVLDEPLFVAPVAGNFMLAAGSPCIDAASPSGAPAVDIDGSPRDALPDMGAYEHP